MDTVLSLKLLFETTSGKSYTFTVPNSVENPSAAAIQGFANELKQYVTSKNEALTTLKSATMIETSNTEITLS